MKLLVKGGRVVDPSQGLDGPYEVLVEDGQVAHVAEKAKGIRGARVLDATGLIVTPGLIDMHVHIESETNPRKYMEKYVFELCAIYPFAGILTFSRHHSTVHQKNLFHLSQILHLTLQQEHPPAVHLE